MKTKKFFFKSMILLSSVAFLTSCGGDDNPSLPPIGGYNSADEVAAESLKGYWPLDGNGKEAISNTSPSSTVGTTWETGIKGQGAKLTAGYMEYPTIAALAANLNAFTISAWVKVNNNQETTATASVFFSLTRPNEWEGNINFFAETGQRRSVELSGAVNDSLVFKNTFRSSVSGGENYNNFIKLETWMVEDNIITPGKHVAGPNKVAGTWAHGVVTWDGATNKLIIYSNGAKISSPAFEVRGSNTSIVFDTPSHPIIGGFGTVATTTDVWNKPMTGNIDEIRVYNKALTLAEIGSLYALELAGR